MANALITDRNIDLSEIGSSNQMFIGGICYQL